jgi:2-polyprenyl-6-methoxyphenol hydroxylase-like FAD-dependent oxidoreductase
VSWRGEDSRLLFLSVSSSLSLSKFRKELTRTNRSRLKNGLDKDGWNISATPQELISTFPTLDSNVKECFLHATDIKVWRLYAHNPYLFWTLGRVALMGDAAHPMMPDQALGFGQAIEDAATLGVVFGKEHLMGMLRGG